MKELEGQDCVEFTSLSAPVLLQNWLSEAIVALEDLYEGLAGVAEKSAPVNQKKSYGTVQVMPK